MATRGTRFDRLGSVIPQTFITDLLARADIVEIVGRHVELKKAGANYKGLCPFHGEKTPSFTVSASKQFYHCFGCGAHGTAITFLMEHTGVSFVDAVKDLAGMYGLKVPEERSSAEEQARAREEKDQYARLTDALRKANDYYRMQLKASPRAIAYLKGRGLTGQIAALFGLGYAPDDWRALGAAFADYASNADLVDSGLVVVKDSDDDAPQKRYDRLRDRITFPIRNTRGDIIGFGGRVLDKGEPKYLNSPETSVFHKGEELYGLFEARQAIRQKGYVIVVEGYMDVVALAQNGFENAVATLGTACTPMHVQKLFRHTEAVVFSFDGDAAGRRAARRALEAALPYAGDTRTVRFLFLPNEHDPDSYVRELGTDAFERAVSNATPLSTFFMQAVADGCALGTAEGRSQAIVNAKPMLNQLPDGALRVQILQALSELTRTDLRDLKRLVFGRGGASEAAPSRFGQREVQTTPVRRAALSAQERAVVSLLSYPAAWEQLSEEQRLLLCEGADAAAELVRWLERVLIVAPEGGLAALQTAVDAGTLPEEGLRLARQSLLESTEATASDVFAAVGQLERLALEREAKDLAASGLTTPDIREQYLAVLARLKALNVPIAEPGLPSP